MCGVCGDHLTHLRQPAMKQARRWLGQETEANKGFRHTILDLTQAHDQRDVVPASRPGKAKFHEEYVLWPRDMFPVACCGSSPGTLVRAPRGLQSNYLNLKDSEAPEDATRALSLQT